MPFGTTIVGWAKPAVLALGMEGGRIVEYYFDQLDPVKFQRLINTILVARFGEDARLTPLRGQDGGRDGETASGNPYFEFQVTETTSMPQGIFQPPRRGRYLFQVKHHRTTDTRLVDARQAVVTDFVRELKDNVLKREGNEQVNYFFLITNVPSSGDALDKLDRARGSLLRNIPNLHADVWWKERVITHLDQMPSIWSSFPEVFAGGVVPVLARVVDQASDGLPRAIRLAVSRQYDQDRNVKFRQIELEQSLSKLFVDLDIDIRDLPEDAQQKRMAAEFRRHEQLPLSEDNLGVYLPHLERRFSLRGMRYRPLVSAFGVLLDDDTQTSIRKLILEGGPGQGKSTLAQMAVQIYRQQLLGRGDIALENRWLPPMKIRLPFRVELRRLAEWLSSNPKGSVEEYLAFTIKQDSGGCEVGVDDIHTVVEKSPVLLIFDGLDEIGNDKLRDDVLKIIKECVHRFEVGLQTDLRVIVTTRPPALAGRRESLIDFERLTLAPMERDRIEEYVTRWLTVQIREKEEQDRIRQSFERRQDEPHVEALARNPMQLSVLLQFIGLKGEAFPDRRAELYRDYFQIVIDRDVEKSPELRENRDVIEALHAFLGYRIHALTEVNQADRTLERQRLLSMVRSWLESQGHDPTMANQFFKLGEERFGLVVASKGEGEETKYGYEVQPIQEYFAAAFISNQIPANSAHEVFEAMIHRSYWREVALFLAGLRRPNEKADLVARAKRVDQDKKLGWYQSGRAIALQLLHEGVFSEPRYVFSEALDFVLDLLDARKLKTQREPPDLLNILEALVSRNPLEHHQERIVQLVEDYDKSNDWYVLMRIYKVASQLLLPDDFEKAVWSYKGDHPELIALVRLGWPYRWGKDSGRLARNPSFWQGVPYSTWAEVWWREALLRGVALDLPVPVDIHQYLIEQFATDPTSGFFYDLRRRPFIETLSKLAIWRMVRYQQILQVLGACKSLDKASYRIVQEEIASIRDDNSEVDYSGLGEPIGTVVRDVMQLSRALLMASCNGDIEESPELEAYIEGIREHLQHAGLASWVACRCAMDVIQSAMIDSRSPSGRRQSIGKVLLPLAKDVLPFFEETTSNKSGHVEDEFRVLDLLLSRTRHPYRLHLYRTEVTLPRYVRLKRGTKPVALVDLLAECVRSGSSLPFTWMRRMSISTEFIRPLVERCRKYLPDLLAFLGEYSSVRIGMGTPLRIQDTQRILKIARNTDDPNVLAGAATALMSANFLRIAEPTLIQKILQGAPEVPLATMLLGVYKMQIEDREQESFGKEIKTVEQVARGVLDTPDKYAFETVCRAADFLAEHQHIEFSPLLYEEENLGIRLT
jgi:hypothetical protein